MIPNTGPLTVAWISDFSIEWLPDIPESLRALPREHPATWEMVLLDEFEKNASLKMHVIVMKKHLPRSFSFERNGVTFHLLKHRAGTRAPTLYWLDTILIRRVLRKVKPAIVHAWGSEKGAGLVASRLSYPYLMTIQGLLGWYGEVLPLNTYEKFCVWIEKKSLARARDVSTESKFAVAWLQKNHPHLAVHQIEHAPRWLFHQIRRQPASNPIRFLSTGTLGHRKGTDLLLRALAELAPDFRFEVLIVGAPNEAFTAPLLAQMSPETRRRFVFKSNLSPVQIADELSRATIFLLPTRADTSPNAVKEAVAAGVPVVASDIGGIPDYVVPGENGYLFKSGDQAEFAAMIKSALRHPLFSRGLVSPASLERSREYLSPARMAERFLAAYQSVRAGH
jgi:glycosyltransferase involved in cell wall biosynthesis